MVPESVLYVRDGDDSHYEQSESNVPMAKKNNPTRGKPESPSLGGPVLPCRDKLSQQHPSAAALRVFRSPGLPPSGTLENVISRGVCPAARSVPAKHS